MGRIFNLPDCDFCATLFLRKIIFFIYYQNFANLHIRVYTYVEIFTIFATFGPIFRSIFQSFLKRIFFRYNRFRYGEYEYVKKKTEIKLLKKFYLGSKTSKSDVFVHKQNFLRNSISIFSSSDSDSPYQNL